MRQLTPHVARAYELLADGEWHDRDRIAREMAKTIPPGIAVRHAEKLRRGSGPKNAPAERKVPRSTEFLIASGKKSLIKVGLRQARIEHREAENGRMQVRLRPPAVMSEEDRMARAERARVMFTRTSPHFERALEVLADGQWRDREEVVKEMMPFVPEESAMRASQRRLDAAKRRYDKLKALNPTIGEKKGPGGRPPATPAQMLERGARALAIDSLVHGQRFEHRKIDNVPQIRLRQKADGQGATSM